MSESHKVYLTTAEREYLAAAQRDCGLKGQALAAELGISDSALSAFKLGQRHPTSELLVRWLRLVGHYQRGVEP